MEKATRDAYGHALIEIGTELENIIVFDSDLSKGTRTNWFQEKYPERFFNIGIAEQNMVGFAAGLSLTGKIPFITTYAIFVGRAYDQIRQAVSFSKTNVKIIATHCGLSASFDGGSHQGLEDMAIMRVLPGMIVISPADYNEVRQAIFTCAKYKGPIYMRIGKFDQPIITDINQPFVIGKSYVIHEGTDVAVFATGFLVSEALKAAELLKKENIFIEVINVSSIKPLDKATLTASALKCGAIVTAEEHNVIGGLYSAVCELFGTNLKVPIAAIAMHDKYGETGSWEDLLKKNQLSVEGIIKAIKNIVKEKKHNDNG